MRSRRGRVAYHARRRRRLSSGGTEHQRYAAQYRESARKKGRKKGVATHAAGVVPPPSRDCIKRSANTHIDGTPRYCQKKKNASSTTAISGSVNALLSRAATRLGASCVCVTSNHYRTISRAHLSSLLLKMGARQADCRFYRSASRSPAPAALSLSLIGLA